VRGYLIPRFEELFESPAIAVGLSSVIFASYHIYQGVEHVVAIFMLALVYGISFCILRRLWPLVIAHTITNMLIYLNI
jgi:membrane protease YdiL (CAAX protease family)